MPGVRQGKYSSVVWSDGKPMCLSTVYMETKGQTAKVLEDVACMEVSQDGYLFIDLFGGKTFVQGQLVCMDFVDENAIMLKSP